MVQLTLTEAASILDPPMSEHQLRIIIRALNHPALRPVGRRRNGHAGRPAATYDSTKLHQLHGDLASWLEPQRLPVPGTHQRRKTA
jgi:hypothetical protein